VRVAVTGATGFVGSHVAIALTDAGHEVVLLVRDTKRVTGGLALLECVVGDVTDRAAVRRAMRGCDAVIHAAGVMTFDGSRAGEARRVNIEGAAIVLSTAVEMGADPVVYVSSISALWPPTGPVLGIDEPVKPSRSVYGGSKAGGELVARQLQADGAPVVIVYPGGVYGPGDPHTGEVTRGLVWLLRLAVLPASPGGFPTIDVRDLADAIERTCAPGRGPRRYMLGGRLLSARDLADTLAGVTGRRFVTVPTPAWLLRTVGYAGDVLNNHTRVVLPFTKEGMDTIVRAVPFDNTAAESDLGFSPRPVHDTLTDAIRWLHTRQLITARQAGHLSGPPPQGGALKRHR